MGTQTEPEDQPFHPNERQQRLIEAAIEASKKAQESGCFVPDELLRRMQSEEEAGLPPGEST